MSSSRAAITMYRGDSYPIRFTLTDSTTGQPLNLDGATLTLTVDERNDPADETTQMFQLSGTLSATPADGTVSFTPTSANTATVGQYWYDVQLAQGGTVRTVIKNRFTITQDITK